MIGEVGIAPEKYWSYTIREVNLLADCHRNNDEREWTRTRNIEFAQYSSQFGFDGKKIFKQVKKPKDLYELPSEIKRARIVEAMYDPERAIAAYNKYQKDQSKHILI